MQKWIPAFAGMTNKSFSKWWKIDSYFRGNDIQVC